MGINGVNQQNYNYYNRRVNNNFTLNNSYANAPIFTGVNKTNIDSFQNSQAVTPKDGKDDGSIGFFGAVGNLFKGVGNFFKGMVCDESGKFSWTRTLTTIGMGAAIGVACTMLPAITIAGTAFSTLGLISVGFLGFAGLHAGSAAIDILSANTDAEAEQAWQSMGSALTEGGLAYLGYRASGGICAKDVVPPTPSGSTPKTSRAKSIKATKTESAVEAPKTENKSLLIAINKEQYINESEYLGIYRKIVMDWKKFFGDEVSNSFDNADMNKIIEIEQVIKTILAKSGETADDINNLKSAARLKYMVDLFVKDEEAYNYLIKSDVLFNDFFSDNSIMTYADLLDNLNINSLKAIEALQSDKPIVNKYTSNSDYFNQKPENIEELHNLISQYKVPGDINLVRGERHVGLFKDVPLDKSLSEQLRNEILSEKSITQDIILNTTEYTESYMGSNTKSISLYDFIQEKKELSLSDAMELCKFFDDETVGKILAEISKSVITDSRFKSYTFSNNFAKKWARGGKSANIVVKTKVNAGTEAIYADKLSAPNGQYEIILNNNLRTMSYRGLSFDRDYNTFYLESTELT